MFEQNRRCSNFLYDSFSGLSSNQVDIQLLSLEDGRLDIVNTTRYLSQAVRNRQFKIEDITPCNVDALMQGESIYSIHNYNCILNNTDNNDNSDDDISIN